MASLDKLEGNAAEGIIALILFGATIGILYLYFQARDFSASAGSVSGVISGVAKSVKNLFNSSNAQTGQPPFSLSYYIDTMPTPPSWVPDWLLELLGYPPRLTTTQDDSGSLIPLLPTTALPDGQIGDGINGFNFGTGFGFDPSVFQGDGS